MEKGKFALYGFKVEEKIGKKTSPSDFIVNVSNHSALYGSQWMEGDKEMNLEKRYPVLISTGIFLVFAVFLGIAHAADTIKIGIVAPLTGSFADEGNEMARGVEMAVEDLNAHGGLFGKKLEMIKGDVGDFSAEKIMSVAEKILNKNKVDCVIAHYLGGAVDIKAFGGNEVPYLHMDGYVK
jgi:ABC-type branched-subunit amino acid transport system substrate-binding protein